VLQKQLEAFEVWIWRRMLKTSWKDKVINASVLEKIDYRKKDVS